MKRDYENEYGKSAFKWKVLGAVVVGVISLAVVFFKPIFGDLGEKEVVKEEEEVVKEERELSVTEVQSEIDTFTRNYISAIREGDISYLKDYIEEGSILEKELKKYIIDDTYSPYVVTGKRVYTNYEI
ncbi:TcaA NTF2-like domain-containing protein, partial [Lysinibacillus sp. NPDC097287]|uniref:TcaA NTF2-like domain-containing protein n=1 Tax=Lysinibacillus sp. NPDC097287 TaxID=3364144 RepID=UPI00381EF1A3